MPYGIFLKTTFVICHIVLYSAIDSQVFPAILGNCAIWHLNYQQSAWLVASGRLCKLTHTGDVLMFYIRYVASNKMFCVVR